MGQFQKKSYKGGQMEVKVEAEQVSKIRNLQNSIGCENPQPCKIYAVVHFSSVLDSNFLPTSVVTFEFGLDSSCLD